MPPLPVQIYAEGESSIWYELIWDGVSTDGSHVGLYNLRLWPSNVQMVPRITVKEYTFIVEHCAHPSLVVVVHMAVYASRLAGERAV